MKSDIIFLDRIAVLVRIGTSEAERSLPQELVVSIRLNASLTRAAQTDDVRDSVDYSVVEREVRTLAEGRTYNLVETLAEAVASTALRHQYVTAAWVRVEKKVLKSVGCVGVEIWREKK